MPNLSELGWKLQLERLFVKAELDAIRDLNKQIRIRSEQLSHLFWTTRQHHLNMNYFVSNNSQGVPAICSQKLDCLGSTKFVDGFKELGYRDSMYTSFLQAFKNNPTLAAACLAYGEKMSLEATSRVIHYVITGIYGNSILSGYYSQLLELIETLILVQLSCEDDPRRVIRKGNAQFCIAYKLFSESSMSSRLFLTSALQEPILQVLMDDELYLERDANRVLDCFSQSDIEKKFGKRDDPEFQARIQKHIKWTEDRFFEICKLFVDGLRASMFCFPKSLTWVIARTYHILKDAGLISQNEARAVCVDLMMQMFISPAIVTPELYGVTGDTPISEFTRFNLMQIAQTLQVLTLGGGESQRDASFYNRFDEGCMSSLLDDVINTVLSEDALGVSSTKPGFHDCSMFLTSHQLAELIQFLKDLQITNVKGVDQTTLSGILELLPEEHSPCISEAISQLVTNSSLNFVENDSSRQDPLQSSLGSSMDNGHSNIGDKPVNEASGRKLFSKTRGKSIRPPFGNGKDDSGLASTSQISVRSAGSGDSLSDSQKSQPVVTQPETVLVISSTESTSELPGMLSENEVLEMESAIINAVEFNEVPNMIMNDSNPINRGSDSLNQPRFSHCSTDLSDIEAALSSTSGSSMDDIDPTGSVAPDDTSSFHGTSSHGNQDEDLEMEEGDLESVPHANNDEALKALEQKLPTSRESIEDKMRKFEIRPQLGVRFGGAVIAGLQESEEDRGYSGHGASNYLDNRSETWSTDVYASDCETANDQADQNDSHLERLPENVENPVRTPRSGNHPAYLSLFPRDEDSRSEVWSVEVLPSDSEPPDVKPEDRLQELESESAAGQEDTVYPLEDNRSRASTPGMSAASGVSGVSAASLVSDALHVKGAEEHGSSSEKSFGKTPSSISPDADDMLISQSAINVGASSSKFRSVNSSFTKVVTKRDGTSSSNAVEKLQGRAPVTMNVIDGMKRNSNLSNDEDTQNAEFILGEFNDDGLSLMESPLQSEETNTIKRSPHQHRNGRQFPLKNVEMGNSNDVQENVLPQNSSAPKDLRDFDPLATSTELFQDNAAVSERIASLQLDRTDSPLPKRHSSDNIKSMERKKSWWKSPRIGFSSLSTRKKVQKSAIQLSLPGSQSGLNLLIDPAERPNISQSSHIPSPQVNQAEDILEKYKKKAASAQSSPQINTVTSGQDSSSSPKLENKVSLSPDSGQASSLNGAHGANYNQNILRLDKSFSSKQSKACSNNTVHDGHDISSAASHSQKGAAMKDGSLSSSVNVKKSKPASSKVIADAQRKLRMILSTSVSFLDSSLPMNFQSNVGHFGRNLLVDSHSPPGSNRVKDEILMLLHLQLAEAVNLQDHSRIAQIHETTRCIQILDQRNCKDLLQRLWKDYKRRSAYITYLVRTKQTLLSCLSNLQHSFECTQRDQDTCKNYLTSIFVKLFLKKMDEPLMKFRNQFSNKTAADEKVALVRSFLKFLYGQVTKDQIWESASDEHLELAERSIERSVFLYIYKLAIFPNGDGDVLRDQLFYDHIARLQEVITPQHSALLISENYLNECPWLSAQAEIKSLNAHKTPRDKLAAVLRCCNTIMNLLKLADENNVPGADDFTPVLVFVLIKANPRHLLSTVQYIQSFLGDELYGGEESYWWMQFTAATEFIKTIDERS